MVVGDMANFSLPHSLPKNRSTSGWEHPPRSSGMKNFVTGMMSPFTACWQPDIAACVPGCGPDYHRRRYHTESSSSAAVVVSPLMDRMNPPQYDIPISPVTSRYQGKSAAPLLDDEDAPATDIEKPHQNDVLCGRGGSSNRHLGNMHFRELVAANKKTYIGLTKKQKMLVARKIVEMVHATNPPGRFLAKDLDTGLWYDIGLPRSLEKTSQALREKNSNDYPTEQGVEVCEILSDTSLTYSPRSESGATSPIVADDEKSIKGRSSKYVEAPPLTVPPHLAEVFGPKKPQEATAAWPDYSPSRRHLEQPYLPNYPSSQHPEHYGSPHRPPPYDVPPRSPHPYHAAPSPPYTHPEHKPHYHHASYGPPETPPQDYRDHYEYYPRHSDPRDCYGQRSPHRAPPPHAQHYRAYPPPPPPPGPPPRPYRHHPPPLHHRPPIHAPEHHPYHGHQYHSPQHAPQHAHAGIHSATPPSTPPASVSSFLDSPMSTQSSTNGQVRNKSEISPERRQEWKRQRNERGVPRRLNSDSSLSRAVENSLTLEERVVGRERSNASMRLTSPSGTLQGRSRPRGEESLGASVSTVSTASLAEKEGDAVSALSGLAALSTAAFLKLDETD